MIKAMFILVLVATCRLYPCECYDSSVVFVDTLALDSVAVRRCNYLGGLSASCHSDTFSKGLLLERLVQKIANSDHAFIGYYDTILYSKSIYKIDIESVLVKIDLPIKGGLSETKFSYEYEYVPGACHDRLKGFTKIPFIGFLSGTNDTFSGPFKHSCVKNSLYEAFLVDNGDIITYTGMPGVGLPLTDLLTTLNRVESYHHENEVLFKAWYNPSIKSIVVRNGLGIPVTVRVINVLGQCRSSFTVEKGSCYAFVARNLRTGVYFLVIDDVPMRRVCKFIVD